MASSMLDFSTPWNHELSLMDWISPQPFGATAENNFNVPFAFDTPSMMFGDSLQQFQMTPVSQSPHVTCDDGEGSTGRCDSSSTAQSLGMSSHTVQTWEPPPLWATTASNDNTTDATSNTNNTDRAKAQQQQQNQHQRAAITHQWLTDWDSTHYDNIIAFPDMSRMTLDILESEELANVESIGSACYGEIVRCLQRHSRGGHGDNSKGGGGGTNNSESHFRTFANANLPPFRAMNCF
ncbi:hypothetical protein SEUCBS139899_010433, partial [Sporothrix eucalyptigena]